jgi:hypothetical protein
MPVKKTSTSKAKKVTAAVVVADQPVAVEPVIRLDPMLVNPEAELARLQSLPLPVVEYLPTEPDAVETTPAEEQDFAAPATGGSYTRCPISGDLTLNEPTE